MVITLKKLHSDLKIFLEQQNIENHQYESKLIIKHLIQNIVDADFILDREAKLNNDQINLLNEIKSRRSAGEPVSKIIGMNEFWGLEFKVSKHTLDPRPDTEILIEQVLRYCTDNKLIDSELNILDIGTGTGCISIALLSELKNSRVIATDISKEALKIARYNVENHKMQNRIELINCNYADSITGKFDIIVSNPPYISSDIITNLSKEVKNHDPILALDGGKDGLDPYRYILNDIPRLIKPNGTVFFEIGYDQKKDILRLIDDVDVNRKSVHPDYAGNPRVVEISYGDK